MNKRKRQQHKNMHRLTRRRWQKQYKDLLKQVRHHPREIPKVVVYNDLPAISINTTSNMTTETRRQADILFESKIKNASAFKSSKVSDKKEYWQNLFFTLKRTMHKHGTVMHNRNINHPECSKIRLQIIQCAIESRLVFEQRSPPGRSPKMSRLLDHLKTQESVLNIGMLPNDFKRGTNFVEVYQK